MNFYNDFNDTNTYLIETIKKGLYATDRTIFDKLDFYDDKVYLDPLIIASLHESNEKYLDFLINCYSDKIQSFEVELNGRNYIHIPNKGRYVFNSTYKSLLVSKQNNSFIFSDLEEKDVPVNFHPITRNKYGIEILKYLHPIIENQFNGKWILVENNIYDDYIDKALELIKIAYPSFFELIIKAIQKVVIYFGEDNSFASIETHGVIYLNVREKESDEIFFMDDILHQSAHVIFNTLTLKSKKDFFSIPYNSLFSKFTGNENDTGVLYSRFHGLFTQSNINICLTNCLTNCLIMNTLKGKQKIEIIGRIVDNMNMFKGMIFKFEKKEYYHQKGLDWYLFFYNKYHELCNKNRFLLEEYDVSNQPYVFNFALFLKTNANKLEQNNLL